MRLELTRRGDYAVRVMLALAGAETRLSVRELAAQMTIPDRFLPQVMRDLVAADLVTARTGRHGGYRIARRPEEVTLLEVIEAAEGDARRKTCVLRAGPCGQDGHCAVHDVFARAQDVLLAELARTRLDQLSIASPQRPSQV